MDNKIVELFDGIKIGDQTIKQIEIRRASVGDTLDAQAETTDEIGVQTLRRRIAKYGEASGPMTMPVVRQLTEADFLIIQSHLEAMDKAVAKQIEDLMGGRESAYGSNNDP